MGDYENQQFAQPAQLQTENLAPKVSELENRIRALEQSSTEPKKKWFGFFGGKRKTKFKRTKGKRSKRSRT